MAEPLVAATRTQHVTLVKLCCELLDHHGRADWDALAAAWARFEAAMQVQLTAEEETVFPLLRDADRAAAIALFTEHRRLRRSVNALDSVITGHTFPRKAVEAFLGRLTIHQVHEEDALDEIDAGSMEAPERSG